MDQMSRTARLSTIAACLLSYNCLLDYLSGIIWITPFTKKQGFQCLCLLINNISVIKYSDFFFAFYTFNSISIQMNPHEALHVYTFYEKPKTVELIVE